MLDNDLIRIHSITHSDWIALRDHLASNGWTLSKGGGLDHSWATLRQGDLLIEMEYDRWEDGDIAYERTQAARIEALLPAGMLGA